MDNQIRGLTDYAYWTASIKVWIEALEESDHWEEQLIIAIRMTRFSAARALGISKNVLFGGDHV